MNNNMDREYKCGRFTVMVKHADPEMLTESSRGFKWVRIYANVWTIDYCTNSLLLLACQAGIEPAHELLAKAREGAVAKLIDYRKRAKAILELGSLAAQKHRNHDLASDED
jgi:hypothetical protein